MLNYVINNKQIKSGPGNQIDMKNFNNSQGTLSNIQNNLNNLSDKQQNFIKQVKYPIEDNELVKDPRSYAIDPKIFIRPEGKKIEIEENLLNKIIVIWDFLTNFNKLISLDEEIISENFFDFYNKIVNSLKIFYIFTILI